jgi:hypothetical protein
MTGWIAALHFVPLAMTIKAAQTSASQHRRIGLPAVINKQKVNK